MDKEEELLLRRFSELAEQSYQNNVFYFTDFLSPADAALIYRAEQTKRLRIRLASASDFNHEISLEKKEGAGADLLLWGGSEGCERVMIRFGNEEKFGYSVPFPIRILHIEPLNKKFADELTHRDFLGALMNLGIERDTIGDILVKDKSAYIFVKEDMAPYIAENLTKVKHTSVTCSMIDEVPDEIQVQLEPVELVVASVRLDAVVAKIYHLSRTQALELFQKRMILVNGRICENNSMQPKEDDVVAVRGYGKFVYRRVAYDTKKGKQAIVVERYV